MNIINVIIRNLRRPVLLATLSVAMLSGAANAANIKMECRVNGYSSAGWIEVRAGSNTGGRVQRDPRTRLYYTDRVQRGERIRLSFSPNVSREYCQNGAIAGAYADNGGTNWGIVRLPFSFTGWVPANPNTDNVHVWTYTSAGFFEKRIPIGSR